MMKTAISWSGGKDSSRALYELRKTGVSIDRGLTTITTAYDRISMHGVRRELLLQQCKAIGVSPYMIEIPTPCTNEIYEEKMTQCINDLKREGMTQIAFGDIFLEDLKQYREDKMNQVGMKSVFPIWKKESDYLANSFIDLGFKTIITCVDSEQLDPSFCGRLYDEEFLNDLPDHVDPCGENGEFHSFCFDGPIFSHPIQFEKGEVVCRDERFYFCDLIPVKK